MSARQHSHVSQILQFFARSRDHPHRMALVRWHAATESHHEVASAVAAPPRHAMQEPDSFQATSLAFNISLLYIAVRGLRAAACGHGAQDACFKCVVLADVGMFAFERSIRDAFIFKVVNRFRFSW